MPIDIRGINSISDGASYEQNNDISGLRFGYTDEANKAKIEAAIKSGKKIGSVINKLHIIKLAGDFPALEKDIANDSNGFFQPKTVSDLCKLDTCAQQYDIEDFLYCKYLGLPINRLITLRRFPYPCTDNIYDKETQAEPDIARMVGYMTQDVNKMEDILTFTYGMKWKELTAEMDQASMFGDQSGLSGFMKHIGQIFDPTLNANAVSGRSSEGSPMSEYDPKRDQNKVYGPVDSIANTHIRDVGLNFEKEIELVFEYELRSVGGRTPEFAFKDLIANVLACTFNNGKFWPGSRYWVGERPTNYRNKIAWMNSDNVDEILYKGSEWLKSSLNQWFGTKESALNTLKQALKGGFALALGKILDSVGRPGILAMDSLLSAEPTGFWHLTIGNPINPIMCIGNLCLEEVEVRFPTDSLSYGDFPNKIQFTVKLKPGQPKDRAGIEMMFNHGKQRIYYAPSKVSKQESKNNLQRQNRSFFNYGEEQINRMLEEAYDFTESTIKSATKAAVTTYEKLAYTGDSGTNPNSQNANAMANNSVV